MEREVSALIFRRKVELIKRRKKQLSGKAKRIKLMNTGEASASGSTEDKAVS